jgi:hypothetical protein
MLNLRLAMSLVRLHRILSGLRLSNDLHHCNQHHCNSERHKHQPSNRQHRELRIEQYALKVLYRKTVGR